MNVRQMPKRVFVVKKQINEALVFRKWDDYSEEDMIIGEYKGVHICKYKKENYKFKIHEAEFADADFAQKVLDKVLVLNNCGHLNYAISQADLKEGDFFQVVYKGKEILTKGEYAGAESHKVECAIVDVSTANDDALGF